MRVHPASVYLVFQILTLLASVVLVAVLTVGDVPWRHGLSMWAMLALVGGVWTQLVWGPCWAASADYELPTTVRITLMTLAGGALLVPFWFLNFLHDGGWLFIGMLLVPYGAFCGALGSVALAIRERKSSSSLSPVPSGQHDSKKPPAQR